MVAMAVGRQAGAIDVDPPKWWPDEGRHRAKGAAHMDQKLDGKTALVTGGSAGIGLGITRCFLEAGANVMITSRKADKCEEAGRRPRPRTPRPGRLAGQPRR